MYIEKDLERVRYDDICETNSNLFQIYFIGKVLLKHFFPLNNKKETVNQSKKCSVN